MRRDHRRIYWQELFPTSFALFVPRCSAGGCRRFAARWRKSYPTMVRHLQKDLPHQHYRALLRGSPTPNPAHGRLWTGSVIPSSQRFNLDWKNRTLKLFTQAA
jgi:hypothetical protein